MTTTTKRIREYENDDYGAPPSKKPRLESNLLAAGRYVQTLREEKGFVDISLANVIQVDSGHYSTLALTNQGYVYGCGTNKWGELALGDNKPKYTWTRITSIPSTVKQILCKHWHSLFLTHDGQVYSCGNNMWGQLVCIAQQS